MFHLTTEILNPTLVSPSSLRRRKNAKRGFLGRLLCLAVDPSGTFEALVLNGHCKPTLDPNPNQREILT